MHYVVAIAGAWVFGSETVVWFFTRWSVNSSEGDLASMFSFQILG